MSHRYELVCAACGGRYRDDGLMLTCPQPHEPAFLRTEYTGELSAARSAEGLARFENWLPVRRSVAGAAAPAVYRAERLGAALGLAELWVAFSGYWPRRGAFLPTGSFKDLEASTVLGRLPDKPPILVIASAGNTAIAFGRACSERGISCLLFVPGDILPRMAFNGELAACVQLVAIDGGAAYSDAVAVADLVSQLPGHHAEGGARNVGRRDGLGVAMLAAYEAMGRLPQWYVQAVGSGAGAIAAHEAAVRIRAVDRAAGDLPRHLMCQNEPYTPLHDLWRDGAVADSLPHHDSVIATELTNRTPPFAVRGGVRDTLRENHGTMTTVTNVQAREAMVMFETLEGVDIVPGAGVALASLRVAVTAGRIPVDASVLLHVTGGGRALLAREGRLRRIEPDVRMVLPRIGFATPSDYTAR